MNFIIYFVLIYGLLIWQGSFSNKDMTSCFEIFLVLQGHLMSCNIISKCGNDSLMFQNFFYKDSLFILDTQRKKSWWYLMKDWLAYVGEFLNSTRKVKGRQ
jgi:hypothetical protein